MIKKVFLMSVFAGFTCVSLINADSATPKSENKKYTKFSVKGDVAAGWWGNLYHTAPENSGKNSSINANNFASRQLIALSNAKMTFKFEQGDSDIDYGAAIKLDLNADSLKNNQKHNYSGLFRDTYVFGKFSNLVEIRVGSQIDAMSSIVDASNVMGANGGYGGGTIKLLYKTTDAYGNTRRDRWVLDTTHANDTSYTNALEIRTSRLSGFQTVINWKPSDVYLGGLSTFRDGKGSQEPGTLNNLVSAGVNYDNKFNDVRVRASVGGVWGISDQKTKMFVYKAKDSDTASGLTKDTTYGYAVKTANSFAYRTGGIVSWKGLDIGLGWLDNLSTGLPELLKDKNAGRAYHAALGYQFDSVTWRPRVTIGFLRGWKNGVDASTTPWKDLGTEIDLKNNTNDAQNKFNTEIKKLLQNEDRSLIVSGSLDLNIREGFRWFVEGMWGSFNEVKPDKTSNYEEKNLIIGTGFAISQ